MRVAFASFLLAAAASSVVAQTNNHTVLPHIECGPDILVDDFKTITIGKLPFPGETVDRYMNLLKADYGQGPEPQSLNFTIDTARGVNVITSTHLHSPKGDNFFFAKFDAENCFDLTNFFAVGFDLVGPTGGNFTITLTQKNPDCFARTPGNSDSDYISITNYVDPGPTKQAVVVPFADFKNNVGGGKYDFVHLKDWTLNSFYPEGSKWEISNLRLIRACGNNGPMGTNVTLGTTGPTHPSKKAAGTPAGGAAGGAAGATTTPDATKSNSAAKALYGIGTVFAGALAAFFNAF